MAKEQAPKDSAPKDQSYEPRLKNVSVRHVPDDDVQRLKFEITAQLADGPRTTVRFRTEVSPTGQVTVA